jgi:hypothetical protein
MLLDHEFQAWRSDNNQAMYICLLLLQFNDCLEPLPNLCRIRLRQRCHMDGPSVVFYHGYQLLRRDWGTRPAPFSL